MQKLHWNKLSGRRGLYHAAVTRLAAGARTFPHDHDFFEMFLVLEGDGIHHRNGRRIPLEAGNLVLVRPEDAHSFSAGAGTALVFVNVAVSARWWKGFQRVVEAPGGWEVKGSPAGHFLLAPENRADLRRLMFCLLEFSPADASELFLVWCRALRFASAPSSREVSPPAPQWLENLLRDLRRPELLVEDISFWQRRSARSPEHLARSCRRFYGAPLNELINRARIDRVKYILQTEDSKITQAAFDVGFNNLAHFYRVFQRLTGRTPQQWRLNAARNAVPV